MSFVRPHVQKMEGYTYGEQPADRTFIKLNTNENPYPPTPTIREFINRLDLASLRLYPDPTASTLRALIADKHDLRRDQVVITNGADEAIRLVMTTFIDKGDVVVTTDPGYTLYEVVAALHQARICRTALSSEWQLSTKCAHDWHANHVKLATLVNPHAPSGTYFREDSIRTLLDHYSGILLLDEAYVDFVEPTVAFDSTKLLSEFPNLLILRTFSKGYSLAGLRVGYLLGVTELLDPILNKTRDSYNVDVLAQQVAECAFKDQNTHLQNARRVRSERNRVISTARELGYRVPDSETNFVLIEHPTNQSMEKLVRCLREHKILVRYFNTPRLRHCMRVTIGTATQNDVFLETLSKPSKG